MIAVKETYTAQKLAQMRDELKVKMHLAKAEARDEWEKLETKWHEFERQGETLERATEKAGHEIREAMDRLGHELKEGYERIRKTML